MTSNPNFFLISILLALVVLATVSSTATAQTACRNKPKLLPHQKGLWQSDFPFTEREPTALCDGSISVEDDGQICVVGRVSYNQIADAVGKPIRIPSSGTVSINGHLVAGSGVVQLGTETGFLYDYVTSYIVNGTSFDAAPDMVDNMLGASRGTIDGVCLDPSFAAEESFYSISHKSWLPSLANIEMLEDANALFVSSSAIVAEYYQKASKPSIPGLLIGQTPLYLTSLFAQISPSFLYRYLPILASLGIFRLAVFGCVSTSKYPNPLPAPDTSIEAVQIDIEWETLITAMKNGLFTTDTKVPAYFGVLIKRITPTENTKNGCWSVPTAAIDVQAPSNWGDKLDEYISDELLPKLQTFGTVGINMGKRIDGGSPILQAAFSRYESQCGVELNLAPDRCYHPICRRINAVSSFTYPSTYYD